MNKSIANIFSGIAISLLVLFYGVLIGVDPKYSNESTNIFFLFVGGLISIFLIADGSFRFRVGVHRLYVGTILLTISVFLTTLIAIQSSIIMDTPFTNYLGPLLYFLSLGTFLTKDIPAHVLANTIIYTDTIAFAGIRHVLVFFVPAAALTYMTWLAADYDGTVLNHASIFGVSLAVTVLFVEGVVRYRYKKQLKAATDVEPKGRLQGMESKE